MSQARQESANIANCGDVNDVQRFLQTVKSDQPMERGYIINMGSFQWTGDNSSGNLISSVRLAVCPDRVNRVKTKTFNIRIQRRSLDFAPLTKPYIVCNSYANESYPGKTSRQPSWSGD